MKEIKAVIRPSKLDDVLDALHLRADLPGVTVSEVTGFGRKVRQAGGSARAGFGRGRWVKLEIVVGDDDAKAVRDTILNHAHTGKAGDGVTFVMPVDEAFSIRTGREALRAATDVDPEDAGA